MIAVLVLGFPKEWLAAILARGINHLSCTKDLPLLLLGGTPFLIQLVMCSLNISTLARIRGLTQLQHAGIDILSPSSKILYTFNCVVMYSSHLKQFAYGSRLNGAFNSWNLSFVCIQVSGHVMVSGLQVCPLAELVNHGCKEERNYTWNQIYLQFVFIELGITRVSLLYSPTGCLLENWCVPIYQTTSPPKRLGTLSSMLCPNCSTTS